MVCPKCHSEYRTGFTYCPNCEVDLVEKLETGVPTSEPHQHKSSCSVPGTDYGKELSPDDVDLRCPACEASVQPGATICPNCGLTLIFNDEEAVKGKNYEIKKIKEWENKESRNGLLILFMLGGIVLFMVGRGEKNLLLTILGALLLALPAFRLILRR